MALRVLLADESSTIKKVFQLALQDFGVEVRPVNIGIDVAAVAKSFKPDIIFADVLLQKKSGYDVCAEIKGDGGLKTIPVVLMWSGFMELDEDKFQAAQANAQLEKPFDVAALRKLVSELVPRTKDQTLSQYLTFPQAKVEAAKKPAASEPPAAPKAADEDFTQVPIPKMKKEPTAPIGNKYRLNLKPEELDPNSIPVDYDLPSEEKEEFSVVPGKKLKSPPPELPEVDLDEDESQFALTRPQAPAQPPPLPKIPPIPVMMPPPPAAAAPAAPKPSPSPLPAASAAKPVPPPPPAQAAIPAMTAAEVEKIVRAQSAEVIESVVWKIIPELASQIIERELNKLLKERESHL